MMDKICVGERHALKLIINSTLCYSYPHSAESVTYKFLRR